MAERSYTVAELDALRRVCEDRYIWGTSVAPASIGCRMSRGFSEDEKNAAVEGMVRTHMLAGHTAEDIILADSPVDNPTLYANEPEGT